jgi:hypothetical protein
MALGEPIAAQAISNASLRRTASEQSGPRPAGVRAAETLRAADGGRTARATRP